MADASLLTNNLEKCCSNYYSNQDCSKGDQCPFLHKTRQEVDAIQRPRGEEFFMGRTRTPKVCRYYLRGNCYNKEHCPYIHDVGGGLFISNEENDGSRYNDNDAVVSEELAAAVAALPSTSSTTLNINSHLWFGPFTLTTTNIDCAQGKSHTEEEDTTTDGEKKPIENENNNKMEMKKDAQEATTTTSSSTRSTLWVNAPEFVPKYSQHLVNQVKVVAAAPKSYAEALQPAPTCGGGGGGEQEGIIDYDNSLTNGKRLCPFMNKEGICRNIIDCNYVHGELCDMCERLVLHPFDEELRKKHRQECLEQHEKNMELSFAIARSKEKTCGVCFEVIMEKANGEQRFGILPNCNHCFCLQCIRKWRQARQFDNKIIRACPECRVTSDFVCPSMYWVDTKEDKEKLIDDYKNALATKDCKYFKKGHGKCPFGNKCFYLHAFADGRKCDVGPPPRQRNHRTLEEVLQQVMLWDFLNERDPWNWLSDDFDTESDESDWSDYEMFDD